MLSRSHLLALGLLACLPATTLADSIDLTHATVVIRSGDLPAAEKIAPVILTEEIAKRTGVTWTVTDQWPANAKAVIALSTQAALPAWKEQVPAAASGAPAKPESFSIRAVQARAGQPAKVFVSGRDPRGVMFGVGKLLRTLNWGSGPISLPADFTADLAPDRTIRGHQIGYRPTANSWDAWTVEQFDQYFRDLVIFGANCVENIPSHEEDEKKDSVMKYPRKEMNARYAELCAKYDLDHWVWVPVLFQLPDRKQGPAFLKHMEDFFKSCKRLDAVFVPGGDPGNNAAKTLVPYLAEMAAVLRKHHPKATVWLSLQHFNANDVDFFYSYLNSKKPTWLGGAVMGPGSPPMEITRLRLPKQYKLRWYPDITHIVRCQYEVPWLDPVLGLTIGREPVNPRPVDYALIYKGDYRFTDGFLSYSDGIHDDFNKNLWTQLAWEADQPVRDIAVEYARCFFRPDLAQSGADAILALESNLHGSLKTNGSVDGTLAQWQHMEQKLSKSTTNWRFDMHLFRAYYDGYQRHRKIYEDELEKQALDKLAEAKKIGVAAALEGAREILNRATTQPCKQEWYDRVAALAESLYRNVGYQTSVPKYHGSGYERGCMMDFVNYPLNDRWWLEDRFDDITKLQDKAAQLKQVDVVRNWENPGDGGYYEVLGDVGRSPHLTKVVYCDDLMRRRREMMPLGREVPAPGIDRPAPRPDLTAPGQLWIDNPNRIGMRFAWHVYLSYIPPLTYTALDPHSTYTVKLFSQRPSPLVIDGKPAKLIRKGKTYNKVREQEFEVPPEAVQDGRIVLSWARLNERGMNWREHHYVTDLWVIHHAEPSQAAPNGQQSAQSSRR